MSLYIQQIVEELKLLLEPLLPSNLVIFDLADTYRRNLYLGHLQVDNDIVAFNDLLESWLGAGVFRKVAGDKWVACTSERQVNELDNLILAYAKEVPISAGWQCRAISPNGTSVFIEEKRNVSIVRAVRCGYLGVKDVNEVGIRVNELVEKVRHLPINSAKSLEQEFAVNPPKWQCIVGSLPDTYCPFCNSTEFTWLEGTDDTAFGTCKQCCAEADFMYG